MRILRLLPFMLFLMICTGVHAQDELEKLREELGQYQRQYDAANALLGKNRNSIRLSENEYKIIKNQLQTRRSAITNLDRQMMLITNEINTNTRQVNELDRQLESLKKEYGESVYAAWKNHKMNTAVAFLFASRDFNDATRRISYMKRYNRMREKKGAEIDSLNYILQYEIEKLNTGKADLEEKRSQRNHEVENLSKEEKQLTTTINTLRTDGKKLERQANDLKDKISKAQKQVDKIIAEQTKSSKTGRSQAQIEQDVILTGKFADNKGKLPWPVSGAVVIDRFGKHAVSYQQTVTNDFKGINIGAPKGSQVKAVFEGEVSGVFNPGYFNNCVTVRSGDYIILYANLAATNVKTGDKVSINQVVGRLSDSDDTARHMLVFQIWKDGKPVDPEQWLRR